METLELTAENFEKHTLRADYSGRGGGIEIDLTPFGVEGEKMSAFQNYLGGGLLGRVSSDCTFYYREKHNITGLKAKMQRILEIELELKKYFHSLTNPDTEWEGATFEENQKRPISAY